MLKVVESVSLSRTHSFSKPRALTIRLVAGHGVEGDAHFGTTTKHVHQRKKNPTRPNLRQVHLIHAELFDELRDAGFSVGPGEMGENVTTRGIDLLSLPRGTRLRLGRSAVIEITGLREPCVQIDRFQRGLLSAVVSRDDVGRVVRKSGVMAIVIDGGDVVPGDTIEVTMPPEPHHELAVV